MRPHRCQFQLDILIFLVTYCWEGLWIGQTHALSLWDVNFGSSDVQIERRLDSRKFRFIDPEADGCTNFYARVCGRASTSRNLLNVPDKGLWQRILNTRLEALISADVTPDDEPAIRKVKRQYQLCMNYDQRDGDTSEALKLLLQEGSDFPMTMCCNSWNPLTLRILEPQKYDPSLFSIYVRDDEIYIDKHDVSVYGGSLSNLKDIPEIKHSVMYELKMKQAMNRMGLLDQRSDSFDKDLKAVMNFRRALHRLVRIEKMVHTRMTIGELQLLVSIKHTDWPQLDWESFLRGVFINVPRINIDSNTEVYVEAAYMVALKDLMLRYSPSCIANHIKLHFLETYMPETSRSLMNISDELAFVARGATGLRLQTSSANRCIHQPHMLRALNYMYLKKWFPKESRDMALNMVEKIKNSLQHHIKWTKMISRDTLEWAKDQIRFAAIIVGSEDKYSDYKLLDPLYRYEVPDNHLSSVVIARRYFKEYEYSILRNSKNTTLSELAIMEDNASVSTKKNIIYLPIGYLHRTSLSPTLPLEMSYATLGYQISLLLNEAIMKEGLPLRKFTQDVTWYGGDTKEFLKRAACFNHQYHSQFAQERSTTDEEFEGSDDEMLDRYMIDNAAFRILYTAFNSALEDDQVAREKSINHIKQDFINIWATRYCVCDKDKRKLTPLRVNNVLRNSNLFHSTFSCNKGELMNPRNKCKFWD